MTYDSTEKFYREAKFEDIDFLFSLNYIFKHTYYETKKKAMENLDLVMAKNVLDVGCGQGHLLKLISEAHKKLECVGIDLNRDDLKRAKQCTFVLAEASSLPFINGCFDRVACTAVLEHVVDEKKVLGEIWKVLNNNGIAVLDAPGMYHLQNKLSDFFIKKYNIFPFHREYSETQVKSLITTTGFELQSFNTARFVGSLILPIIKTIYTFNRRKIVWCRGFLAKILCKIGDSLSTYCGKRKYLKLLGGSWFFKIKKIPQLSQPNLV
ncbi:MAG: class I SAM-dependent methyltransferase [Candidatus Bathyarchaeota archaeon]|jgi:ubiquinone/menaquinone biosynthesis C-methylase UbiE|nr:class I SAM-dependent methyltransferase [Candidatus Bathyarchaeota archaeon]